MSTESEAPLNVSVEQTPNPEVGTEEVQEVQMNTEEPEVRTQAVHLIGVNELSHDQVKEFGFEHTRSPFAIEWINDSELNFAFDDERDAKRFLRAISQEGHEEAPLEELRSTKSHPTTACNFQARIANTADVKPARSTKSESQYYKEHGAPSIEENRVRFGTARSEPMKYARGDLLKNARRKTKARSRDLFPHLAKNDGSDDLFPHLAKKTQNRASAPEDDLFPHLVKNGGIKKSNRRRNKTKSLDAMEDVEQTVVADSGAKAQPGTVYSNMDY